MGQSPRKLSEQGNSLHCFVVLCGERVQKGDNATAWLLEICLTFALFPVTSLTPHMPLVPLPALALVLNPRGGRSAYVLSPCGPFKQSLLKIWQFLLPPKPNWFLQPEVMGIYLPGTGTPGCAVWPELGSLTPKVSFPLFIYHT